MTPRRCAAHHNGLRCVFDHDHDCWYGTDHAHPTPTVIHKWGPAGHVALALPKLRNDIKLSTNKPCRRCGVAPVKRTYCSEVCAREAKIEQERMRQYRQRTQRQAAS